ncbi:MAG: hypothetical protein AB8B69_21565 [Chitinophagales bacterium]
MNRPSSKIWKYIAVTLSVLVFLLLVIQWGISQYLCPVVIAQLETKVEKASKNMYGFHCEKVSVNLIAGKLNLRDIRIQSNREQILQKHADCELPTRNIFDLKIPKLTLTGIDLYDAVVQQHINIDNIVLQGAIVQMLQLEKGNCPAKAVQDSTLKEDLVINKELQSFFIGNIAFQNTQFEYLKLSGLDTLQVAISHNLNAHLSDLEMAKPQFMGETIQDLPIKAGNIQFEVNQTIVPIPKSRYNLGIKSASFSLQESVLRLQSLHLIPKNGRNKNVQSVEIQELTLNTTDFFDGDYNALMKCEQWTIPAVELNYPKIVLTKERSAGPSKNKRNRERKPIDFQKILSPQLSTFGIESFKINHASLTILDAEDEQELLSVYPVDLSINNFRIDHSLEEQEDKLFYADDFKINAKGFRRKLPKTHSVLTIDDMGLDMVNAKAHMKNVSILPLHSPIDLGHIVGHQIGWTRIQNMDVLMRGLDINALLSRGAFNVKKILVKNPLVESFMDQRLKPAPNRVLTMPQHLLQNLPMPVYIDHIEVTDGKIEYSAYGKTGAKMGILTMDRFNASLRNLTNNDLLMSKESKVTLQANAYVMGTGFLTLDFAFPLNSSDYGHTFSGSLSEMPMADFNPILEVVPARVDDGKINKITFSAFATDKRARGKLQFYYDDLKVVLKDKNTGKVNAKQDILSFLADKLFIRNDNPTKAGNFREGIIDYKRNPSKSIINFWWKSVLTGIVSSISSKNLVNEDNPSTEVLSKRKKRRKKKSERKEHRKQLRTKLKRLLDNPFK